MARPSLKHLSLVALPLALILPSACSSGSDQAESSPEPDGEALDGSAYEIPEMHPSDWAAPPEELPDAPRPYGPSPEATADPAFYDVGTLDPLAVADAEPGDVLRSEAAELSGPLAAATGWRILYRSTTTDGSPAVVSALVLVPAGPPPPDGRPVAAWDHGTTGIADRCAPSTRGDLFYEDYGSQGQRLLDQGFVVVATDYHGLGTPGVHSYHVSDELALATVDAVAAVHRFEQAGPLTSSWVVVGHSEGGLAALATDQRSDEALPELDYLGAVVAAPSNRLGAIAPAMFQFAEGRGYAALLLEAAAEFDPELDPAVALKPVAAGRQALLTHGCWEEAVPGFADLAADEMLASAEVAERLGEVLDDCCTSDATRAVGPMLVVHGESDEALPPVLTEELVGELCSSGVAVEHLTYPGATHDGVLAASASDAHKWLAGRLAGEDPPSNCG